jgi:Cu-processing system permease protein
MSRTAHIVSYELSDVVRRRWVIGYALFFVAMTEGLLWLGGGGARVAVSLIDVVLLIIPLVSITFAALYVYNAQGFLQLLLSQPLSRRELFAGTWAGLVLPLVGAFVLGVGVPLALADEPLPAVGTLIGTGTALTVIFVALGLLVAAVVADKIKGLGLVVAAWLCATVVYDGFVLVLASAFGAHVTAGPVLGMMLLNPIDLARLVLLTQLDAPALLGYTGALAQRLLGGQLGIGVSMLALVAWCAIPTTLGLRAFERRDW